MFFIVALAIWTALHAYVFWRAATIPLVAQHVPPTVLVCTATLLWALFPIAHAVESARGGTGIRVLVFLGDTWLGVLFLLFVALLAVDVVTMFGVWLRTAAPALRGWALLVGFLLAAIALVQGFRPPVVDSYEVTLAGLPAERDGTVIVLASDLHLGSLFTERWLAARVEQIEAQRPDLIVLAGDIVEGHGASGRALVPLLKQLAAPLGVWAVNGNHETYGRMSVASVSDVPVLEQAGFHVLRNQWAEVRPGLVIAGVDDLTSLHRYGQSSASFVDRALNGRPAGATIFVSTRPG